MSPKPNDGQGLVIDGAQTATDLIQGTAEMTAFIALAVEAGDLAVWYYDPHRGVVGGDAKIAELFGMP